MYCLIRFWAESRFTFYRVRAKHTKHLLQHVETYASGHAAKVERWMVEHGLAKRVRS